MAKHEYKSNKNDTETIDVEMDDINADNDHFKLAPKEDQNKNRLKLIQIEKTFNGGIIVGLTLKNITNLVICDIQQETNKYKRFTLVVFGRSELTKAFIARLNKKSIRLKLFKSLTEIKSFNSTKGKNKRVMVVDQSVINSGNLTKTAEEMRFSRVILVDIGMDMMTKQIIRLCKISNQDSKLKKWF
eukprot:224584_1